MRHTPVLLEECMELLAIKPDGLYVDATLGMGGHTRAILDRLDTGKIICFDRDPSATESVSDPRATVIHSNFRHMSKYVGYGVDGILFDIGVSSPQLDNAERGFSYHQNARLDMRMDTTQRFDAHILVNSYSKEQLEQVIRDYGEERYAEKIAYRIVKRRDKEPINTTLELAETVKSAMPPKMLRESRHPAMRTFQAIRIAVNDELGALSEGLEAAIELLKPGGRLVVISFHSLEDRAVKNIFLKYSKGCVCPPDFPVCVCGFTPVLDVITRQPLTAGEVEMGNNRRARSAKLRAAEKCNTFSF